MLLGKVLEGECTHNVNNGRIAELWHMPGRYISYFHSPMRALTHIDIFFIIKQLCVSGRRPTPGPNIDGIPSLSLTGHAPGVLYNLLPQRLHTCCWYCMLSSPLMLQCHNDCSASHLTHTLQLTCTQGPIHILSLSMLIRS